jgi:hypothetical protein
LFGKNTNFDGERENGITKKSAEPKEEEEKKKKSKRSFFFGLLFCRVLIAMGNVCCSWTMTASGRGQRSRPKTWTQLGMRR